MKRALFTLLLLATGQASASYCHNPRPSDTRNLDKLVSVTLTDVISSSMTETETSAYASGLLRSKTVESKSTFLGNSTSRDTYTYTATGKINTIDNTYTSRNTTSTNREVYEYDTQDRLTRVLAQKTPRASLQVVATCTYGPSTITERTTAFYGFRPDTLVYTLDPSGRATQLTSTTEGSEGETDVTTFTYRNGTLLREEQRLSTDIVPLTINIIEFNDAGLVTKYETTDYTKDNKVESQLSRTYTYDMDALGNWTSRRQYSYYEGTKELDNTDRRVISYKKG